MELEREIETIKSRNKAQEKWHKIVEMFHLFNDGGGKTQNGIMGSGTGTPKLQSANSLLKAP
jgi:hypothetical protein